MKQINVTPVSQDNKGRFNRRIITVDLTSRPSYHKFVFNGKTDTGKNVVVYLHSANDVFVQYAKGWDTSKGWGNQYATAAPLPEGTFRFVWSEKGEKIADYDN